MSAPTFSPFRFFGLFPKPATNENVEMFGFFDNQNIVDSSTIELTAKSIPFYWLLHKISFSVQWEIVLEETFSDSFIADFIINEYPQEKICKESNVIISDPPNEAIFTEEPSADPNKYDLYFRIEPFQCQKVHSIFGVFAGQIALSTGLSFYLTTAPPLDYGGLEEYSNIYFQEESIELPNGQEVNLNAVVDFFDADYEGASASASLTIENFEWYELES